MPYTRDGLEVKLKGEYEAFYCDDFIEEDGDGYFDVQELNVSFSPNVIKLSRPGEFRLLVDGESKDFRGTLIEEFHVSKLDYDEVKDQYDTLRDFEGCGRDVGILNAKQNTDYEEDDIMDMAKNFVAKMNELVDHYGMKKVVELYKLDEADEDL
ncbi:hypothetical protein [Exiguobacterium sp. s162]|uniref:hypothetical protein n=1 Tax=Exiguobacterium sp. s162 TaxID=2751276 RepID=UPI001BEBC18C|nr:hypothetical protein [Exiguobacterium sp. s162]